MKKSRLGQNFLFDPTLARRIVDSAEIGPDDTVVEIGPGHGILTRIIAEKAERLVCIEFDSRLYEKLVQELGYSGKIEFLNIDVMKYDFGLLGPFSVIANIPYYITTPIIFKLIEEGKNLKGMTLTIQKEVAERIIAPPGNKDYGILSLMVQFYGSARLLFRIPAGAFTPRPKVDSAVIHIERYAAPPVSLADRTLFDNVIKTSFAGRRKMLSTTLRRFSPDIAGILREIGIDPMRRPETLSMEEFALISNRIAYIRKEAEIQR